MGARQIHGLDLLRFAAAMLVTVFHLGEYAGEAAFTWFGWVGVQVFFILSGFVIAYSAHGADAASFLKRRIVRLMPAVWICASITFALLALEGSGGLWPAYLRTLVLWPFAPWISGIYWTLIIEAAFYGLVFAVLAAGRREQLAAVLMAVGAASTVYWLLRVAGIRYGVELPAGLYWPRYLLLEHGCFFALGGLLWACLLQRATAVRVLAAGVFMVTGLVQTLFAHNAFGGASPLPPLLIVGVSAGLIVLSVRLNRPTRHARVIRLVGLTTYPLYLLHMRPGATVIDALGRGPVAFAVATVAVVLLSALVAAFVEPVVQGWLRRALDWRPLRLPGEPAPRPR